MKKKIIWGIIIGILALFLAIRQYGPYFSQKQSLLSTNRIALINIEGEILDTTHILEMLNYYSNIPNVKVILLRVNSPGGGVAASQEVYRQIMRAKEKGKKIVVSMSDTAASGAYYISSAADKIVANPGTITGSIGVIISYPYAKKLLDKIGLEFITVKSGQYKDVGSLSSETSENQKKLLQTMINDVLYQFVGDVVDSRLEPLAKAFKITEKKMDLKKKLVRDYMLKNIADGRILTGRQALDLGLVDQLGNIDDAIEAAAKMAGIKGRPLVISERKKETLGTMLSSMVGNINFRQDTGALFKYILQY